MCVNNFNEYASPVLEVVDLTLEKGFAESGGSYSDPMTAPGFYGEENIDAYGNY